MSNRHLRNNKHITTYLNGAINFPRLILTTQDIEERLVRDEQTNELYIPLSLTVVLKRKKAILHVPLYFKDCLTVDALVDSGAYVRTVDQKEVDRFKQDAPAIIFQIDNPPKFHIQVARLQ